MTLSQRRYSVHVSNDIRVHQKRELMNHSHKLRKYKQLFSFLHEKLVVKSVNRFESWNAVKIECHSTDLEKKETK